MWGKRLIENDQVLCASISMLMQQKKKKHFQQWTKCSMKNKPKRAKLVGDKYILQCGIKNTNLPILKDKGAQVSIIEQEYICKKFLNIRISLVEDLLGSKL